VGGGSHGASLGRPPPAVRPKADRPGAPVRRSIDSIGHGSAAAARGGGERARTALAVLGWAAVGVAAPLLVRGLWLAAIACIAAGAALLWRAGWLLTPGSADAYLRRVADALSTRAVETEAAYDEHRRRPGRCARCRRRRCAPIGSRPAALVAALDDDARRPAAAG
jgi:hypothetical protein